MAKKAIPLFEPGSHPIKGMNSSLAPASVPEGFFTQLTNMRFGSRQASVRPGIKRLTSAIPTSGAALRGAWSGTLNSVLTHVGAYRVGSYTLVYNLDPSAFTWTEITADGTNSSIGNKYGNTRFPTDGHINFSVIRDVNGNEILLMQNGTDTPRVYDPNGAAHAQTAIHRTVNPPTNTTQQRVFLDFPAHVALWENGTRSSTSYASSSGLFGVTAATNASPIAVTTSSAHGLSTGATVGIEGVLGNTATNGIWTITVTGASTFTLNNSTGNAAYISGGSVATTFSFVDSGLGQNFAPSLLITSLAAVNETASINFEFSSGLMNLSNSRQLIFIVSCGYLPLWDNIKVEAQALVGTNYCTIYDPTQPQFWPVYVPSVDPNNANTYAVAFSLDGLDPSGIVLPSVQAFRFTWVGTQPPPTAVQCQFLLGAASGQVQGGASYGIGWSNSGSRSESYGLILPTPTSATLQSQGGNPNNGLTLPITELLYYRATVYYQDVSTAEMDNGTDTLSIYRLDPGDTNYYLTASTVVNTFNTGTNAWVGSTGSILTFADTVPATSKNYSLTIPDSYQTAIPVGAAILTSNSRLYVGGCGTTKSEIWVSEDSYHVRFLPQVRFINPSQVDPTSAVHDTIPGEVVTGFGRISGHLIGVDPITVFTTASVYRLDGIDATSLSRPTYMGPHGCPYPGTIGEHSGTLYWVDCEQQLMSMAGAQMKQISRFKVDNKLASGTLTNATGAWLNQRYYLGYQPAGQSVNTNALVFEELYDEFCEDNFASGDCGQLVTIDTTGGRKVYMFSSTGYVYQLENATQTTDDGTAIPITITTPEIHNSMWGRIDVGRIGIVIDPGTSTLTISRTWKPASVGVSGTINLNNILSGDNTAFLWEHRSDDQAPGGSGLSVITSITGTLPGFTNIYSLVMELGESGEQRASNG